MNSHPIGIFDSGIGGLSILREISYLLPNEDLIYVGDTAFLPYGIKSKDLIEDRTYKICRYLLSKNCKAIVVACNTATSAAIHKLRATFSVPIIGIEPPLKPATQQTQSRVIGILATEGTLEGEKFATLKQRFGNDITILHQPCTGLVEVIEAGDPDDQKLHELLKLYVLPLVERGADTLVLGCTHFPLIKSLIAYYAGPKIAILDPSTPVANELKHQLKTKSLLRDKNLGTYTFLQTGANEHFGKFISRELGLKQASYSLNV
ncbi:MAG: glutamate racemase [Proteobacteria bacterium]|nr:glutamate racemase [Pseudomonadota bacterium]MDA1330951.1 glutamate racemase [Pseudomonadota bacterium]